MLCYNTDGLRQLGETLLARAGLAHDRAATVAGLLVEADMLGHTTHGLALLPAYLKALGDGGMACHGEVEVVRDTGACVTWQGRHLPGVWLTAAALDLALERAPTYGTVTVVIRESHHIGCLAVYLTRATERGCMALLGSSDPAVASVAPHGGRAPVMTPNPLAVGIPTDGDPILIDISASITTNGMSARLHKAGERFAQPWLLDGEGRPSDDPAVLALDPPGSILPIGGLDHGHKGYGLGLMIEALTQGLGGFGRADAPRGWGASTFLQVIDPEAFGGGAAFRRQTSWLAAACRSNPPRPGVEAVRLPGDRALALRRRAVVDGLALHPGIMEALEPWARRAGLPLPEALAPAG